MTQPNMTIGGVDYVRRETYPSGEAVWEALDEVGMPRIRQYPLGAWRIGPFTAATAEEALRAWREPWFVLGVAYQGSAYWGPSFRLNAQEALYPDLLSRDSGWTAEDGIWATNVEDSFDTPEEALANWAEYRLQGVLLSAARLLLEASKKGLLPVSATGTNALATIGLETLEAYRLLKGPACRGR